MPIDSIRGSEQGYLSPPGDQKAKDIRGPENSKPAVEHGSLSTAALAALTRLASQLNGAVSRSFATIQTDLENIGQALHLSGRETETLEQIDHAETTGDSARARALTSDLDEIRQKSSALENKVRDDNLEAAPNRNVEIHFAGQTLARIETQPVQFTASRGDPGDPESRRLELARLADQTTNLEKAQSALHEQKQQISSAFERGSDEVSRADESVGRTVRSLDDAEQLASDTRDSILQKGEYSLRVFNSRNLNGEVVRTLRI